MDPSKESLTHANIAKKGNQMLCKATNNDKVCVCVCTNATVVYSCLKTFIYR